jgi:hypothetical protein
MYQRFATSQVEQALADTRVVLLAGPRQTGKTTLARTLADEARVYHTLDNASTLAAALADPTGFVRALDRAIIDEVQRAPELMLAIKESVDTDLRPGRFLLTGLGQPDDHAARRGLIGWTYGGRASIAAGACGDRGLGAADPDFRGLKKLAKAAGDQFASVPCSTITIKPCHSENGCGPSPSPHWVRAG